MRAGIRRAGLSLGLAAVVAVGYLATSGQYVPPTGPGSQAARYVTSSPDGTITASKGTLAINTSTGSVWQNTDGATVWRPFGARQLGWQSGRYYFLGNGSVTTTNGTANNEMRLAPFYVPSAVTISRIGAEVTVAGNAGSKVRLGIYADDGAGRPGVLVLDAGTIDGDAVGVQEIDDLSTALGPGWYWEGWAVQGASSSVPTMRSTNAASGVVSVDVGSFSAPGAGVNAVGASQSSVSGALPETATPVMSSGIYPRIFVKI